MNSQQVYDCFRKRDRFNWFSLCWMLVLLSCNSVFGQEFDWIQFAVYRGETEEVFLEHLEIQISQKVDQIEADCHLSQDQATKLRSAARYEKSLVVKEVSKLRIKVSGLSKDKPADERLARELTAPLARRLRGGGLFEANVLFDKVVRTVLTEKQLTAYEDFVERKRSRLIQAMTMTMLADLEKRVPLVDQQRQELLRILNSQDIPKSTPTDFDWMYGYLRLAMIDKSDLSRVLDENQATLVEKIRSGYKDYVNDSR